MVHSNILSIIFLVIRLGWITSRWRLFIADVDNTHTIDAFIWSPFFTTLPRSPSLTFHDISALERVGFPQRSSVKTTRHCDIAYLSYEWKILIEEIKSSIALYSMEVLSGVSLEITFFVSFVDSFLVEKSHWYFTGHLTADTDWGALYHVLRRTNYLIYLGIQSQRLLGFCLPCPTTAYGHVV